MSKAVQFDSYGGIDVLKMRDVPRPVPGAGEPLPARSWKLTEAECGPLPNAAAGATFHFILPSEAEAHA